MQTPDKGELAEAGLMGCAVVRTGSLFGGVAVDSGMKRRFGMLSMPYLAEEVGFNKVVIHLFRTNNDKWLRCR